MSGSKDYEKIVGEYYRSALVNETFLLLDSVRGELIEDWRQIAKIYSPSGNEILRTRYLVKKTFRNMVLKTLILIIPVMQWLYLTVE